MECKRTILVAAILLLVAHVLSPDFGFGANTVDNDTIQLSGGATARPGGRTVFRSQYLPLIRSIAAEEGVDDYLVQCIVKVESDFNAGAVSVAGATGLMQIMLDVARAYGVSDPFDPGRTSAPAYVISSRCSQARRRRHARAGGLSRGSRQGEAARRRTADQIDRGLCGACTAVLSREGPG